MPAERAPFFVVGNDRSGTTMLRSVLDRSAEAAVPPESMFMLDFAPVRRRGGLEKPDAAAAFVRAVWSHPRVRAWKLPGEPPSVPPGLGHAEAYRFAVEAPFRAYARAAGKERFGDKTPAYLHAVDELLAVWPDARVVVLVRDARDVALSIAALPFGPNNAYTAARWWARGIRRGLDAQRRHPEQVLTVRYEDLVRDPPARVEQVCAHLGLGYNSEMLAIEASDRADDGVARYARVIPGITAAEVGKWRSEMSREDQRIVAVVAGPELRELGYAVEGGEGSVGGIRTLGYAAHDAALRAANLVRLRVVEERGHELGYVVRRKLGRLAR